MPNFILSVVFLTLWHSFIDSSDGFIKNHKTHISIREGKLSVKTQLLIQINNPDGNKLSEVGIGYTLNSKIKNLEARLIDIEGLEIRSLKNKDVTDRSYIPGQNSFSDYFIKEFKLVHNQYPYLLSYSFTQEYDQFIFDKWYPNYRNIDTQSAQLILEFPRDYRVRIFENDMERAHREIIGSDVIRYTWNSENIGQIVEENFGPSWEELRPSVTILPETFFYGVKGNSSSWQSYGNWIYSLGEDCNDLSKEEMQRIKSKIAGLKDKRHIVKTLYHDLQNQMRYVNISMDIGGMKPYPASYVINNKFGDCKALTYYMKSILESIGIDSYPIDVYWSKNPIRIQPEIPTQQFNHVFLCIPMGNDTLWLENTSNSLPFDYLDSDKQGEMGLLIKQDSSLLIRLPPMSLEDVRSVQKLYLTIEDGLNFTTQMSASYRGEWFERLRYIKQNLNSTDQSLWMKRNFPIESSELLGWNIEDNDRNRKSIKLSADFLLSNHIKKYGDNLILFVPKLETPKMDNPETRKYDFRLRVPICRIDTIQYNIDPTRFRDAVLQQSKKIDSPYGSYQISFFADQDHVTCVRSLNIPSTTLSASDDYTKFYEFIERIKTTERQSYIQLKQ